MRKKPIGEIIVNIDRENKNRIMLGIPLTGLVRAEWAMARYGQATPTNWSLNETVAWLDQVSPLGFTVPTARNLIVEKFIEAKYEWLFFLDHDVILPPRALVTINNHIQSGKHPIVNGLYFTKSKPAEPLLYRGSGTSFFMDWKMGDQVYVDGAGMGCTLIHRSIMKAIYDDSEEYTMGATKMRKVFRNPSEQIFDEATGSWGVLSGTEDLDFYTRLQKGGYYKKAGWPEFQKKKYPLLIDTSLFCRHISNDGMQYPAAGEEYQYMSEDRLKAELASIKKYGAVKHARMNKGV